MESRLSAALRAGGRETIAEKPAANADEAGEAVEAVAATAVAATSEGAPNAWPDESTEAAILSELREKGEAVKPVAAVEVEEVDPKALPPLDELLKRIPAEVRETLDDLFRAKFVRVVRLPKKALK